ncbi:MAG: glutamyl-tRNA reductase [Thermodesulfobacteriota bacterium]|nr:glutamyl-tRNA reductase [Thermodesulfobacteriota bacterium]
MNRIKCVSINHKVAPTHIREQIRISPKDIAPVSGKDSEAYVLNTCNRTEVYYIGIDTTALLTLIGALSKIDPPQLEEVSEIFTGKQAIYHLFMVASGLDSAVLGEPQILGQVKEAYRDALKTGITSTILNKALHRAFRAAKRIRTETPIGRLPVSVASEAVELACHIFGDIQERKALIIGAGDMATIAARRLKDRGVDELYIVNRTYENADNLAKQLGGKPKPFDELHTAIKESDIVISSTASARPVITCTMMNKLMKERKHNLIFIIDIALPRDVEQDVGKIYNCYLYDIDALKNMVDKNITGRMQHISKAQEIIDYETSIFEKWMKALDATRTIKELYSLVEIHILDELKNGATLGEEERGKLERALRSMAKRLLNRPVDFLKSHPGLAHIEHTRRIFQLDEDYQDRHKGKQTCPDTDREGKKEYIEYKTRS